MKISTYGLDIQPGKYKYSCECFEKLIKKFEPKKVTNFTVEFVEQDFDKTEAVVFAADKKFDYVFIDLEKIEKRLTKTADEKEKVLLEKAQKILEQEQLLCDQPFSPEEKELLRTLAFVTYKPSLGLAEAGVMNDLIRGVLDKSETLLFNTAGKKEVRAWDVKKGDTIVDAAGRIHSDLARGFIKGDVVNCDQLDNFFNMAEARAKGLVAQVGKEYLMRDGDIIEIKFNV